MDDSELKIDILLEDIDPKAEGPDSMWIEDMVFSVLRQGRAIFNSMEVPFLLHLDSDGIVKIVLGDELCMIKLGGQAVNIGVLKVDENGECIDMEEGAYAESSICERNLGKKINEDLLFGFLEELKQVDEYIKRQEFYKEAVVAGAVFGLIEAEKKRDEAEVNLEKELSGVQKGALLKHPSRFIREWAIRRIGDKANKRRGR